jgi:hypothetical protein
MKMGATMKRAIIGLAVGVLLLFGLIPAASAQEITGGCSATVNGRSVDTLTLKRPLVVAEGDTVALTGSIPAGAAETASETRIFVEVVGDVPVATAVGNGAFWGGSVEVPEVLTRLAPGVYKVKGTAEGSGWICNGSAYIKVEGGPMTAATAIGAIAAVAGIASHVGARQPKQGQVFNEAAPGAGSPAATAETGTRWTADLVTLGLFGLLVALVGFVGPSWVI